MKGMWVAASLVVFLCLSVGFIVSVDRSVWFDEGFSLETVRLMDEKGVDFSQYDVHPPVYYHVLNVWMDVPHGSSERVWARLLSVLCGAIFLLVVAAFLEEIGYAKEEYGRALFLFATGTTMIYYSTEMRMYVLEMLLSAVALFAVVRASKSKGNVHAEWSMVWCSALVVLPFIHYFAVVFYPVFLVVLFAVMERKGGRRFAVWNAGVAVATMVVAAMTAFLVYALPQMMRIDRMYLGEPSLRSFISALFYGFHVVAEQVTGWWGVVLLVGFLVMVCVAAWVLVRGARNDVRGKVTLAMMAVAILPLVGIIGGVFKTYHHRYFLVVLWMFSIAVYIVLTGRWKWLVAPFALVNVVLFSVMVSSADTEMRDMSFWLANSTKCDAGNVVHETTWTYIPFEVYEREWCRGRKGWDDWLSTEVTERMGRSAGEDAINVSRISRGTGNVSVNRPFSFVSTGLVPVPWDDAVVVWEGPGANLSVVGR